MSHALSLPPQNLSFPLFLDRLYLKLATCSFFGVAFRQKEGCDVLMKFFTSRLKLLNNGSKHAALLCAGAAEKLFITK